MIKRLEFMKDIAMTNAIYYVKRFGLYVGVVDDKILDIQKGKPREAINPHAIIVDGLAASFAGIYVDDDRLYLDGFALTNFMTWLWHEKRYASPKAFIHRLEGYFPGSNINDVLLAISHVTLGMDHHVNGEQQHFAAKVRDAHPAEFAELQLAFAEHLRSHGFGINDRN